MPQQFAFKGTGYHSTHTLKVGIPVCHIEGKELNLSLHGKTSFYSSENDDCN